MNKKTTLIVLAVLVIGFGVLIVLVQNYTDFFKRTDTVVRQDANIDFDIISDQQIPEETVVLKIATSGGLCSPGVGCRSEIIILKDGTYLRQDVMSPLTTGELPIEKVDSLIKLIEETDFAAIKSKAFKGTCPTAYDGQETTYTFYPMMEEIPSCVYEIDENSALFKQVFELTGVVYGKL